MKCNNVMIGSEDPKKLTEFYEKVFGKKPDWVDSHYTGFDCDGFFFTIGPHDKVHGKNTNPERFMLNFEVDDVVAEFNRIKKEGAKVIAEPYDPMGGDKPGIATFADVDGNYFQLMRPWSKEEMEAAKDS